MEGSIMGRPILSTSDLDLDPTLHHATTLHRMSHHLQGLAPLSTTQHLNANQEMEPSPGIESKCNSKTMFTCGKGKSSGTSDEDERSFTEEGDCGKGKNSSPWHRVKWTDAMVKLLIQVVVLVGEDGTNDSIENSKKKSGILQKKGKWKSVSQVMNKRGCSVSPQQCEDKFNDLNKRYKRLNDILGKGIACCVVENPCLLDTMENLSSKAKDDVRKILSSKQLFYKEICAYHNGSGVPMPAADLGFQSLVPAETAIQNHDLMNTTKQQNDAECEDEDDDQVNEDIIDDANDDEEEAYEDRDVLNDMTSNTEAAWGLSSISERYKKFMKNLDGNPFPSLNYTQLLASEPSNIDQIQVGVKIAADQQQLFSSRILELEEQKVKLLAQTLELSKQRLKWERINSKRYRELEQQKLDNQKTKLENKQLALQLKQKEIEAECKRSEVSMNSIDMILERLQSKEPMEYNQGQPIV